MLRLVKYDILGSYRSYLLTFLCYLLICVTIPLVGSNDLLYDILMGLLIILVIGLSFSITVNLILSFNRSMFKRPGYLTLTLPVSTKELLLSKVISSIIWILITVFILLLGSFLVSVVTMLKIGISWDALKQVFQFIIDELSFDWSDFSVSVVLFMASSLSVVTSVFTLIIFTHTRFVKKYRAAVGIIIYFLIIILFSDIVAPIWSNLIYNWSTKAILGFEIIINLIVFAICFFISDYLLSHQIELD